MSFLTANRWSQEETAKLAELRAKLGDTLTGRRQLPDVVGDRRLLRFLRARQMDIEKASKLYAKFLAWRDEYKVDDIRDDILYGGRIQSPLDFPNGSKIIGLVPQIVMAHDALDIYGNPISMERFCFQPDVVLREITKDQYIIFMIYMMEYKILVLEQMADEREKEFLARWNNRPPITEKGYGVLLTTTVIRDFAGFGLSHMGSEGRTVMTWILGIALDNYPEVLFKSHMINAPFVFSTLWVFLKTLLDASTIAKVTINGSGWMDVISKEVPVTSIPASIGGKYDGYNKPYEFNISRDGPFYYPGMPIAHEQYIDRELAARAERRAAPVSTEMSTQVVVSDLKADGKKKGFFRWSTVKSMFGRKKKSDANALGAGGAGGGIGGGGGFASPTSSNVPMGGAGSPGGTASPGSEVSVTFVDEDGSDTAPRPGESIKDYKARMAAQRAQQSDLMMPLTAFNEMTCKIDAREWRCT
jgi:CRAL/TRIO domain